MLYFVFILMTGFVFAAGGWGDTNVDAGDSGNDTGGVNVPDGQDVGSDYVPLVNSGDVSSKGGTFYTTDFYIALGVGGFVLVLLAFVIWFFIRGPKDKWEK